MRSLKSLLATKVVTLFFVPVHLFVPLLKWSKGAKQCVIFDLKAAPLWEETNV